MTAADLTPDEFAAAVAAVTTAFGDPTRRDIYLFVRARPTAAPRRPRSPSSSRCTPTSPATTSRSSPAGGYLDVELARHESAGPAVEALPRERPTTRTSRSRPAATTCSARCSPARSSGCRSTKRARLAEEVGYEYGRAIAARMEPGRRPPLGEGRGRVGRRRADRARLRRARRVARQRAHARRRALPVRRGGQQYPHVLCAVDTGMVKGMLEGLYGETQPTIEQSRPARRRALRHPRLRSVTRAYLDHASSSPLRPAALDAMLPYLREHHADPGRLHAEGPRDACRARRRARAGRGVLRRAAARGRVHVVGHRGREHRGVGRARAGRQRRAHVVTTAVEHSCVRDAIARSRRRGHGRSASTAPAASTPAEVLDAIRADTALVSVQLANHEVGTLQPAAEVCAAARERGVLVHVDACAAAGHVPVDFRALDADLCSVTAHKFGGPKGAGALLVRRGLRVAAAARRRRAGAGAPRPASRTCPRGSGSAPRARTCDVDARSGGASAR